MKIIIRLSFLSLIGISSNCFAMTDKELCAYFERLNLSPHPLRLQLSPESSPEKKFTPATSWQDESLMEHYEQQENVPPVLAIGIQNVENIAHSFLESYQEKPKNKHPLNTRGQTFYIPRSIN